MDYSIHVRTPSDQIYNKVVETLEPLGVEIVAGETDPLVMATFYLSRMNTKQDNLGQLRHLHKLVQYAHKSAVAAETQALLAQDTLNERKAQRWFKKKLFDHFCKETGTTPDVPVDIGYLTEDQITALFDM